MRSFALGAAGFHYDKQAASTAIEAGYATLMQVADSISESDWCNAYLENVPESRALWQRWNELKLVR